ncbi:MAG TPA: hypothetical protein VIK18_10405, partial [Pirellulales bacterium]
RAATRPRPTFAAAHRHLWRRRTIRSENVKRHGVETSMLEGIFSRGDRRVASGLELAWRRGARLDRTRQ